MRATVAILLLLTLAGCGESKPPGPTTQELQVAKEREALAVEIAAKAQVELAETQAEIERLNAEKIRTEKQQALETARKEAAEAGLAVEKAREKLAAEEKRVQSFEARFGSLTPEQQNEIRTYNQKAEKGEKLYRHELERLQILAGEAVHEYVKKELSLIDVEFDPLLEFRHKFRSMETQERLELNSLARKIKTGKQLNIRESQRFEELNNGLTPDLIIETFEIDVAASKARERHEEAIKDQLNSLPADEEQELKAMIARINYGEKLDRKYLTRLAEIGGEPFREYVEKELKLLDEKEGSE